MTAPTDFTPDTADALLQELAMLDNEWAVGASTWGPGGYANDVRKSYLAARAMELRDSQGEKKLTEAYIADASHADAEYIAWLESQVSDRATWLVLDARRDRIYMELELIKAQAFTRNRNGANG